MGAVPVELGATDVQLVACGDARGHMYERHRTNDRGRFPCTVEASRTRCLPHTLDHGEIDLGYDAQWPLLLEQLSAAHDDVVELSADELETLEFFAQ